MHHVFKADSRDDSVLIDQWHYVSYCSKGGNINHIWIKRKKCLPEHGLSQFERNSASGQHVKWISTTLRIHNSNSIRQNILTFMVICYDQIKSYFRCKPSLLNSGNSAVHCDDKFATFRFDPFQSLFADAISFILPIRNIKICRMTDIFKILAEDYNTSNPVHIIIAINPDGFLALYCKFDSFKSKRHIRKQKRVV